MAQAATGDMQEERTRAMPLEDVLKESLMGGSTLL
jgi:hypothetical protein